MTATKERIYEITISVKMPDVPFPIERSFGHSSGDLRKAWRLFKEDLDREFAAELGQKE